MGDLNQNECYLFFELSSKSPMAKAIQKMREARKVTFDKCVTLATEFHKDATPLTDKATGICMRGICVPEGVKVDGWRQQSGWPAGWLVPRLTTKVGKAADAKLQAVKIYNNKDTLVALITQHFGHEATGFRTVAAKNFSRYLLTWTWGNYPVKGKETIYILRLLKTDEADKAKVRGCKKVKYSRLVEIEEISEGEE